MDYFDDTNPPPNFTPLSQTVDASSDKDILEDLESVPGLNIMSPTQPTPPNFSPLSQTYPDETNPNFSFLSQPLPLINSDASDDDSDVDDMYSDNRKPRGRPHGSKNKIKHVTIEPFVLHIFPGDDIIQKVVNFASVHKFYMSIVCGHGHVTELDVCYPWSPNDEPRKITGSFRLISCTGYFSNNASSCFCKVSIADSQGNVVNDLMAQRLIAESQVQLAGSHK